MRYISFFTASLNCTLILSYLHLDLPNGLFPLGFLIKLLHVFSNLSRGPQWLYHSNMFDVIILIILMKTGIMNLHIMQFSAGFSRFLPSTSKHFLNILISYNLDCTQTSIYIRPISTVVIVTQENSTNLKFFLGRVRQATDTVTS
jgi:hypothetical protein